MHVTNVCLSGGVPKDKFQQRLAAAWGRVWPKMGKGAMAGAMGLHDTKTIDRAVTASNLPEAHTVFNSLCADPTALDEVLGLYGFKLCPTITQAANDMGTLSGLCEAAAAFSDALRDGVRVHPETLLIADKLRPLMPALSAIISDADALRGVA